MISLDLSSSFIEHILSLLHGIGKNLLPALFDLLIGIVVIRILVRFVRFALHITNVQPGLRDVITSIIETVMWIFLSITILQELGFSGIIYFFTGSIAAIGLAMAAGGSTLISDIIAGIFLARDGDFNVGDEVIAGERPTLGVIESQDARRTRIRDDQGVLHVIPNSVIERKEWMVIRRNPELPVFVKATKAAKRLRKVALQRRAAKKDKE